MSDLQNFIHSLEEGRFAKTIRWMALFALCFFGVIIFVFDPFYKGMFKGLTHAKGMEQAAIAKQIISGNGFSTPAIRPLALSQMKENERTIPPMDHFPDTYYGPVWPATLAPFMGLFKDKWVMAPNDYIYLGDRIVTTVSALFFFLAAGVSYFTVRRLFDPKIAIVTTCLTLLAGIYWRYLSSGLSQMEMFFFFSLAMYTMIRAIEAKIEGRGVLRWLSATAALFGVLALTNGVSAWIFVGVLVFTAFYFPARIRLILVMVAIFALVVAPWLVRNYQLSGNPLGTGFYSMLHQVGGDESSIMRSSNVKQYSFSPMQFRAKMQIGVSEQLGNIYMLLGGCLAAPLFFIALMHPFRRPEVRALRWLLLSAWIFAIIGTSFARGDDGVSPVAASDQQLFFIPLFAAYGLAFLYVMWGRLEISSPMARTMFVGAIFLISAIPMINIITTTNRGMMVWPPYIPSYIGIFAHWTEDKDVIVSDMPWAVGWYANRSSLWLPTTTKELSELNDYDTLKAPIAGVHLTPITGDLPLWSGIIKGYKEWIPLILRSPNLPKIPFTEMVPLPVDGMCVYYTNDVGLSRIKRFNQKN